MSQEKRFDYIIIAMVIAVHTIALWAMGSARPPSIDIGIASMQLVTLGDLDTGKAQEQSQPQTVKKTQEKPKEKLIAHKKEKADIAIKDTTEPSEQPEQNKPEVAQSQQDKVGGSQEGAGEGDRQAMHLGGHLNNPKPPYPPVSRDNGEEGSVTLRVTVEANGLPSSVKLEKSSGYPRLDRSALNTVRQKYRFTPARKLGVAVKSEYVFNIIFKLDYQ